MHDLEASLSASSLLETLIERIRLQEGTQGAWRLGSGELRKLLGIGREEYYRRLYAAEASGHPMVSLAAATASFSQENIWEFVALVELFCGPATERRLQAAGVFFTHPEQLEIMGRFVGVGSASVREHSIDSEQFSSMLAVFGSYERARSCYLDEHFPLETLVDAAAEQYCSSRRFDIPELARKNARNLLHYFFQKHVLEPQDLFARISAQLFEQAVREGYAEAPGAAYGGATGAGPGGSSGAGEAERSAFERARRMMELDGRPLTATLLKGQYKRLMKRYHPDLNPEGLRRCQEINAAYALILSAF